MAKPTVRGRPPFADVLTPSEWRVVQAVRHGLTNRAIAERRGISVDAVKFHVANAVGKLGLRDRRALRNWTGIPAATAMARMEKRSMDKSLTIAAIGQVSRTVSDVAAAEAWYRDILGLTHLYTFGTMSFFECGGVRLFLSQKEAAGVESILYLLVDDIRAMHELLTARGVEFLGAPHLIHTHADGTEEWMVFFNDLDGRPLALMSRVR